MEDARTSRHELLSEMLTIQLNGEQAQKAAIRIVLELGHSVWLPTIFIFHPHNYSMHLDMWSWNAERKWPPSHLHIIWSIVQNQFGLIPNKSVCLLSGFDASWVPEIIHTRIYFWFILSERFQCYLPKIHYLINSADSKYSIDQSTTLSGYKYLFFSDLKPAELRKFEHFCVAFIIMHCMCGKCQKTSKSRNVSCFAIYCLLRQYFTCCR